MDSEIKKANFRQDDIKPCACCGLGIMHPKNALGLFWKLKVERLIIDRNAVQRQHGLEMMLGGAATLARVLGPDEKLAFELSSHDILICETCVLERLPALFAATESADSGNGNADQSDMQG